MTQNERFFLALSWPAILWIKWCAHMTGTYITGMEFRSRRVADGSAKKEIER